MTRALAKECWTLSSRGAAGGSSPVPRALLARVRDWERAELERVASSRCPVREVVRIYCPSSPHVRAVVAHLLKDEVVARGAGVDPQHFQLIVREGRTIAIDLGAVGGVLRLLPLLARQRTVINRAPGLDYAGVTQLSSRD